MQLKYESPAQYFFNFGKSNKTSKPSVDQYTKSLGACGLDEKTVKLVTIPVKKNQILLRVENLADSGSNAIVYLDCMATYLVWSANLLNPPFQVSNTIVETTLTANMDLKEMLARKLQWKTLDDISEPMMKEKMEPYDDLNATPI